MLRPLAVLAALALIPLSAPAAAQGGFLVEFNFDALIFRFHPSGLGSSQAPGSGLEILAQNVRITGEEAKDLRHCIDGWNYPKCTYCDLLRNYYTAGNRNGQVEANEVAAFEPIIVMASALGQIERVNNLSRSLQESVTISGARGDTPRLVDAKLRDAIGNINSTTPAFLDATAEMGFHNDRKAPRAEIVVRDFRLDEHGFSYSNVQWTSADSKWVFRKDPTEPGSLKDQVTDGGLTASQEEFETATEQGVKLVLESGGGKKRTPGVALLGLVVAIGAAIALRRRP
jgi:hypothetical protein